MQLEQETSSLKAPEPGNHASRSSFLAAALFSSPGGGEGREGREGRGGEGRGGEGRGGEGRGGEGEGGGGGGGKGRGEVIK